MTSKLQSLKFSGPLSFSSKHVHRFLRFRAFVFHFMIFLWHASLNYQTTTVVYFIFQTRMDLVNQTYGLGIQYITLWNQFIQQGYFNACLLQDILEFTPPNRYVKLKEHLSKALPYAFTSIVVPMAFLVLVNFWTLYTYNRSIIDEFDVTASYFPLWVNHALHTSIVLLVLIEKLVVHRNYPPMLWGLAGMNSVIWAYISTCVILYFVSGFWPYPLFGIMTNLQRICFIVFNMILAFFAFVMGEKINNKIWGRNGCDLRKEKVS